MYLAKMTTAQAKEAFEKDPIIVIPVGSTEQHGTQGALGTDFMVRKNFCRSSRARLTGPFKFNRRMTKRRVHDNPLFCFWEDARLRPLFFCAVFGKTRILRVFPWGQNAF